MKLTLAQFRKIARGPIKDSNAIAVMAGLDKFGERAGLDKAHRLVHFVAQIMHESAEFRYDREIWGPTPAQTRYDTRTDLGNTPAVDGDGKLFMGRTAMQLTGKHNYTKFRDWVRANVDRNAPDFVANPEAVVTDPWEGLVPIWYWTVGNPTGKSLNRFADDNNIEIITRRINGGLNGYEDRLALYDRAALVLLDFPPGDVEGLQSEAEKHRLYDGDIDGLSGPKTRSAMHRMLAALDGDVVAAAPVTEVVTKTEVVTEVVTQVEGVAVAPPAIDKPMTKTTGFWERITSLVGLGGAGLGAVFQADWRVILAILAGLVLLTIFGLVMHARIITAVKSIREAIERRE